jgi:putative transposase
LTRIRGTLTDGGIYHVYNRGNNRRDLFQFNEDFEFFLGRLLKIKTELNANIYHYCLMSNHFHLLVQVEKGQDLSKLMQRTLISHAQYFKRQHEFIGHVYEGKFRSSEVKQESYFLQCGRYIERNPVRAGMVNRADRYLWSSAAHYCRNQPDPLVTPDPYYLELGKTPAERTAAYRKFLAIEEPYSSLVDKNLFYP